MTWAGMIGADRDVDLQGGTVLRCAATGEMQ